MSEHVDEGAFTPMFLESLTDLQLVVLLVVLQHDLRTFPEDRDRAHLDQVMAELKRRAVDPASRAEPERP